ncbi:MAG: FAD-linked oxidase C-terminal domain-containing protein, partial [Desulfovibrio sp.]|nr:FAD-linked oxidase C-terminal domain-containing protein [Desulfovibrio sp.]
VVPCTLEFLDHASINYIEDYVKIGLPRDAGAMLLIEVDGHPAQVEEDAAKVEEICKQNKAASVTVAEDAAQRDAVWQARRDALPALANLKPTCVLEDATVPRSKIPAMIDVLGQISKKYDLTIGTFGHAGDGNLHPTILTDKRDKAEWERVEKAIDEIFDKALSMGGTLSGEHGIGMAKSKYMANETTRGTLAYSRRMKSVLDPKGILNPGKIISW